MIAAPTAISLDPPGRRFLWSSIYVGVAVALVACGAVAFRSVTIGSVPGNWYYPYGPPATLRLAAAWLLYSAACAALVTAGWQLADRYRPLSIVLAWIVLAMGLQWGLRAIAPYPLEAILVSDRANSFYSVAQAYDPAQVLRSFNRVRKNAPLHVQSNMPGKLLLIDAAHWITSRTDVLPWILIGISSLGALLFYGFVREVFEDERVALASAALYLFLPARTFFFPLMNTVTPVVTFACAWLLARWVSTGKTAYALVMGIGLYGLAFFEPLPFVLGLFFLALALLAVVRGSITWHRFIAQALALIAVFIGVAELVNLLSGFDIVRAFRSIGGHATEFNQSAERPYGLWIAANLREFAFGMGICQVVVFSGALLHVLRQPGSWRERLSHPLSAIGLGLSAVLLAVDLIGMNRGEVIRLWIFLGSFFQIPVAYVCSSLNSRLALVLVVAVTALQTAIGLSMIHFVIP